MGRATVALCVLACAPADRDPIAEVRAVVEGMVEAVEEREPRAILEHVAFDFRAEDGLTYPDVQSLVLEFLMGPAIPGARLESAQVDRDRDRGEVRVRARVRFARGERLSGTTGIPSLPSVVYAFDLRFRSIEGVWRAVGGSYRRSDPLASSREGQATVPRVAPIRSPVPGRALSVRT